MPTLITGSPVGNVLSAEDLFLTDAPYLYFQDASANPFNNPDGDGYYWMLSGTVPYPVYNIGCPLDVKFTEGVTANDVRCDNVGVKDTVQRRDYVELQLTISSLFPLSQTRHIMNLSTPTESSGLEKVGIGPINNTRKFMVYAPLVYDPDSGDYLVIHLHKAKFVDAWTIDMKSGEPWQLTGIKIRAYADDTKPTAQRFGVILRSDASALP